ncbi:hypothetical protein EON83_10820 [bacterium]|nr:MAG: hypothetical protein EON83_10820 [bacterium]
MIQSIDNLRAGTKEEASWVTAPTLGANHTNEEWLFVDVGYKQFHPNEKEWSFGVLDGLYPSHDAARAKAYTADFGQVCKLVKQKVSCVATIPLNLVLEAPLSMAMHNGCPVGRDIEIKGGATRYWYTGAGVAVMTAAGHLLREVVYGSLHGGPANVIRRPVVLFEGFCAFKTKDEESKSDDSANVKKAKSDHIKDVLALREALLDRKVFEPLPHTGQDICSISSLYGLPDFGVPAVIKV